MSVHFHTLSIEGPEIKYLMLLFVFCHLSLLVSLKNNSVLQDYLNTRVYLALRLPILMLTYVTKVER